MRMHGGSVLVTGSSRPHPNKKIPFPSAPAATEKFPHTCSLFINPPYPLYGRLPRHFGLTLISRRLGQVLKIIYLAEYIKGEKDGTS